MFPSRKVLKYTLSFKHANIKSKMSTYALQVECICNTFNIFNCFVEIQLR